MARGGLILGSNATCLPEITLNRTDSWTPGFVNLQPQGRMRQIAIVRRFGRLTVLPLDAERLQILARQTDRRLDLGLDLGAQTAAEVVQLDRLHPESIVDEFGSGGRTMAESRANGPMVLMTAHRAKGLEFDHVVIPLDGGGWSSGDDERRLYYVAMTRARRSLTLCERLDGRHPFVRATEGLALRTRPTVPELEPGLDHRIWVADPSMVYLDWPGRFAPNAPIHRALAALEVGDPLELRPMTRRDGQPGWELADRHGVVVARMAAKFQPPDGEIVAVRVAAVLVRTAKGNEGRRCERWELVLVEVESV
jgi:hypothetical protein